MQVSWKGISKGVIALAVVGGLGAHNTITSLTLAKQQEAIESLLAIGEMSLELEDKHTKMLWDLHRRVSELEREDNRLLAHIKWFVMRRSGTDELRKMEAAVARLEAE